VYFLKRSSSQSIPQFSKNRPSLRLDEFCSIRRHDWCLWSDLKTQEPQAGGGGTQEDGTVAPSLGDDIRSLRRVLSLCDLSLRPLLQLFRAYSQLKFASCLDST
jgi:hypothetical protein